MSDTRKRAIRRLMAKTGLKYTQAARLHDQQRTQTPSPTDSAGARGDHATGQG